MANAPRQSDSGRQPPVVVRAGEGEVLGRSEARSVVGKLDVGELALCEFDYEAHQDGPGPHFHREHYDCFYVLAGEMTFTVEAEDLVLGPGDFVAVPPLAVHSFRNASDASSRFLNMHAPSAGFVPYMRALRDAETDGDRRRAYELFDTVDAG